MDMMKFFFCKVLSCRFQNSEFTPGSQIKPFSLAILLLRIHHGLLIMKYLICLVVRSSVISTYSPALIQCTNCDIFITSRDRRCRIRHGFMYTSCTLWTEPIGGMLLNAMKQTVQVGYINIPVVTMSVMYVCTAAYAK